MDCLIRIVSLLLLPGMYRENCVTKEKKFSHDVEMNNNGISHLQI